MTTELESKKSIGAGPALEADAREVARQRDKSRQSGALQTTPEAKATQRHNAATEQYPATRGLPLPENPELARLTRDFAALSQVTEIGLIFADRNFRLRRFTHQLGELFRFRDADIGRPLGDCHNPFPDFDWAAMAARVLRRGVPEEAEARDETSRGWKLSVARYPDHQGVVLSAIRLSRAAEEDHAAAREWRERAQNLAVANRELEHFARIVAHDLRAPLRHLRQFSDLLAAELTEVATPAQREHLSAINSSAGRLSAMVQRLLEYSRLGGDAPQLELVDLGDCLKQARAMLGQDAKAANVTAQLGKFRWVRGDRILVTQLFQNLLENALKFHKPGETANARVCAEGDALDVVLSFEDEGVGVDPNQAGVIFEMFGRAPAAAHIPGEGVGLAFCKRICETLGGSIALDASKRDGARFIVRLPRAKPRATGA